MSAILDIVAGLLVLCGAAFALVAAVGVLRFPDLYTRMHAASKAGTLGSGTLLIAMAVQAGESDVVTRAIAGVFFLLLTTPVSAHLLARSAYIIGVKPVAGTAIDDLAEQIKEDETAKLRSESV